LLIEQYWSYINSSISQDTAKKVNGPLTGISGLGGALGGLLAGRMAEPLGAETLLLFASLLVIPAALMSNFTYRLHGEPVVPARKSEADHMGLLLFRESRILRYLLAIVLATQVLSAVLYLKFQGLLSDEFAGQVDREVAFQANFNAMLNFTAVALQFVGAPLLLTYLPLRWVHILMPTIHLTAIIVAIIEPTVFTVGLAFFLFKAFDYSLFRAAKEILYIPLSYDMRYRAKEVIDVFVYRTGKGATSVVIAGLQQLGVAMANYYTTVAFIAAGLWMTLIFPLTKDAQQGSESLESKVV
jgi:AAA family ATP:ADP antiporter